MIAAPDVRCTPACQQATTPGCTCTGCDGELHGKAHGLPVQLRLGLAARSLQVAEDVAPRAEPTCTGCGRPERVAPAAVRIEAGRFCVACAFEKGLWP